jgi:hypothetical protein
MGAGVPVSGGATRAGRSGAPGAAQADHAAGRAAEPHVRLVGQGAHERDAAAAVRVRAALVVVAEVADLDLHLGA